MVLPPLIHPWLLSSARLSTVLQELLPELKNAKTGTSQSLAPYNDTICPASPEPHLALALSIICYIRSHCSICHSEAVPKVHKHKAGMATLAKALPSAGVLAATPAGRGRPSRGLALVAKVSTGLAGSAGGSGPLPPLPPPRQPGVA